MKKSILFFALTLLAVFAYSQSVTLSFTAHNYENHYVRLDSVQITNLTRDWTQIIVYPDTVLQINNVGIVNYDETRHFWLSQNVPNPFNGQTDFSLSMRENGIAQISVTDISGKQIVSQNFSLDVGNHNFTLALAEPQTCILTVKAGAEERSLKMINVGSAGGNALTQDGAGMLSCNLKSTLADAEYVFSEGDVMQYIGFATLEGMSYASTPIEQSQTGSETFDLEFIAPLIDGEPCPLTPTVTDYDGNVYNTVQVGKQCWMQQNLRTTHYSNGNFIAMYSGSTDESIPSRNYPNNDSNNVATYGYLYNWMAVMNGASSNDNVPSGVQGICPSGWHVPSLQEFRNMKNYLNTNGNYACGSDSLYVAKSVASDFGWTNCDTVCTVGNNQALNNAVNFSALPTGCFYNNIYAHFGEDAMFYTTSTTHTSSRPDSFNVHYDSPKFSHAFGPKANAYSVRCLRD